MMNSPRPSEHPSLQFRNAFADFAHVKSDLVAVGVGREPPFVTIAIPTYRRPEVLIEAVESAMKQRLDRPFEIVVVDNDPHSGGAEQLFSRFPELRGRNFRYFVNRENIGMFGNWTRCIDLARGEWVTVLNDDDLLDENCLELLFDVLERDPKIDGLTCRQRSLHEDGRSSETPTAPLPHRIAKHLLKRWLFMGRAVRRIRPNMFFWGSLFGNSAGFVFKRQKAMEVGGFYPEEFPNADYWFYLRFSKVADFRQYDVVAASLRVGENETANPDSVRKALHKGHELRLAIAGNDAPRWWRHFSGLVAARDRSDYSTYWGVEIPREELEKALNIKLPRHRPYLLWGLRVLLRGF